VVYAFVKEGYENFSQVTMAQKGKFTYQRTKGRSTRAFVQHIEDKIEEFDAAVMDALVNLGIDPAYISYDNTPPDSGGAEIGTKGAYYKDNIEFQVLEWDGDSWVEVGVPLETTAGSQGKVDTHAATVGNHTDVDLTGAADGDYLKRESGVWVRESELDSFKRIFGFVEWGAVALSEFTEEIKSGTGASSIRGRSLLLDTGTTAGSTVGRATQNASGWLAGISSVSVDFSRPLGLSFTFSRIEAGVGAVCYLDTENRRRNLAPRS
jgi:hypothetical protein